MQAKLGQHFIVENRTGAGATIGTAYVAQAAPDGYTLLLMESSAPVAKWLYKNPSFDVLKDFTPIARIVSNPLVLFANPSLPAKDLKELIVYAKDNPTSLSAGVSGTIHQLAAAMLNAAADHDHSCPLSRDGTCGEGYHERDNSSLVVNARRADAVCRTGQVEGAGGVNTETGQTSPAGTDRG